MLAIAGYVEWPAEMREEMLSILSEITDRSLRDEGCLAYWWAEDLVHVGRFRFFEAWANEACHVAHQVAEYEQEFRRTTLTRATAAEADRYELAGMEALPSEVTPPEGARMGLDAG
jgi:quinol monooxygenase YgiN